MANNNIIISNYPTSNSVASTDTVLVLKQTPLQEYWIPVNRLFSSTNTSIKYSESPNSNINVAAGVVLYDSNYLYVAVSNNTLKRVALTDF